MECDAHSEQSKAEDNMDSRYSFIVMEKCGASIVEYFTEQKKKFSVNSVCQLGIGLIDCLQKLHSIGKVHNNLNFECIMVEKKKNG